MVQEFYNFRSQIIPIYGINFSAKGAWCGWRMGHKPPIVPQQSPRSVLKISQSIVVLFIIALFRLTPEETSPSANKLYPQSPTRSHSFTHSPFEENAATFFASQIKSGNDQIHLKTTN